MTESNVHKVERELAEAQKYLTYIETVKEAANTVVEQGLWIVLSVDMFAISRKLYEDDDRTRGTHFLYHQREEMIKLLGALTNETFAPGPFGAAKIPNPVSYLFRFLGPLKDELMNTGRDDGGKFFVKMDPIPTMILVFTVPGLLRIVAKQIGEILPL